MLDSVGYAAVGRAAACFQRVRFCPGQLSDVVAALRETIELAELWVLNEIDPQILMRRGAYSIGATRQILFFHPRILARILEADPSALLEAPLKFAVLEMPNGAVMVRWIAQVPRSPDTAAMRSRSLGWSLLRPVPPWPMRQSGR